MKQRGRQQGKGKEHDARGFAANAVGQNDNPPHDKQRVEKRVLEQGTPRPAPDDCGEPRQAGEKRNVPWIPEQPRQPRPVNVDRPLGMGADAVDELAEEAVSRCGVKGDPGTERETAEDDQRWPDAPEKHARPPAATPEIQHRCHHGNKRDGHGLVGQHGNGKERRPGPQRPPEPPRAAHAAEQAPHRKRGKSHGQLVERYSEKRHAGNCAENCQEASSL